MKPERNTRVLPASFHLTIDARVEDGVLLGGEPFAIVHVPPEPIRAWRAGAPVGEHGALARALVERNLAQPIPPPGPLPRVTAVIPVRDRPAPLARLLNSLEADEVIVVDDASHDGAAIRDAAAGARYIRRETRGGAGAARNDGLAAASHDLVALIDSDCVPQPGWLEALLPHFADPEVSAVAPRIVPLGHAGVIGRYEARRSPLDRGSAPARVIPYGRVPFVPGAALVVRRELRFDEGLRGGEDVDLVWRAPYVRYEPAGQVAHDHRTDPAQWLRRRVYYGRTAAPLAQRHPGNARPLHVSPWTTAAWAALALKRPATALGITAVATALLAKELKDDVPDPVRTATELVALGGLHSGLVIANAITRHWWPVAIAIPRLRAAALATPPLQLLDDLAYGAGVWIGCVEQRNVDALLPARPWRLQRYSLP